MLSGLLGIGDIRFKVQYRSAVQHVQSLYRDHIVFNGKYPDNRQSQGVGAHRGTNTENSALLCVVRRVLDKAIWGEFWAAVKVKEHHDPLPRLNIF
jgi:hypothetical protein